MIPICRPYGTSGIFNIPRATDMSSLRDLGATHMPSLRDYPYAVPTGLWEKWSYAADMHGYSSSPQNLGWKFSRYNCSEARVIAV
jgi:hypothetical protein